MAKSSFQRSERKYDTRKRTTRSISSLLRLPILCLSIFGLIRFSINASSTEKPRRRQRNSTRGDCEAIGLRRPVWDSRDDILTALPVFRVIYDQRPFKNNDGGMKFDHSFALWFILRSLSPKPEYVVESGARRGHSTWVIKQALTNVRVISISPEAPLLKFDNVYYLNKRKFTDFRQTNWSFLGVDPNKSVVLLDDHQSAFRRIFEEGMKFGFYRFIQDDNYGYQRGDNLNMKWLCEVSRKKEWEGVVLDNIGRIKTSQTWEEHMFQVGILRTNIHLYYEFPPVVSKSISRSRSYSEDYAAPALITDRSVFDKFLGNTYLKELRNYVHICYVELAR